jgi:NAD(P)-dependent dehydrogenase (short-subunit alcohol dehydrogenase family)
MSDLKAARVVITAGAAGIGRVMAERFLADGARVAVCDVDASAVEGFRAAHPAVIAEAADVTDTVSLGGFLSRVEREWGGADVVAANAGIGGPAGAIEDLTLDDWRACLSVNLDGAFLTSQWAARVMKAQRSGLLLLTSSTAGLFGYPMRSPYATAKWGIIGLMKTLAMELGSFGIRVNALCPGAVEGPRMDRVVAAEARAHDEDEVAIRRRYVEGVSLKTWVTAEDIAEMAAFLASPAGAKISGQAMAIDGHTETLAP